MLSREHFWFVIRQLLQVSNQTQDSESNQTKNFPAQKLQVLFTILLSTAHKSQFTAQMTLNMCLIFEVIS
jgi:hypothetical protein